VKTTEFSFDKSTNITLYETEYITPDGLVFNKEMIIFITVVCFTVFLCGFCIACCILYKYKQKKKDIYDQMMENQQNPDVWSGE
jgi:hypothetical protein